jgi:hypothetical protein
LHFSVEPYAPCPDIFARDSLIRSSGQFHLFLKTSSHIRHLHFSLQCSTQGPAPLAKSQKPGKFFGQEQWLLNRENVVDDVGLPVSSADELHVKVHQVSSFDPEAFLLHRLSFSIKCQTLKDFGIAVVKVGCHPLVFPGSSSLCESIRMLAG